MNSTVTSAYFCIFQISSNISIITFSCERRGLPLCLCGHQRATYHHAGTGSFFPPCGFHAGIQAARPGDKHFYQLSHLANLVLVFVLSEKSKSKTNLQPCLQSTFCLVFLLTASRAWCSVPDGLEGRLRQQA